MICNIKKHIIFIIVVVIIIVIIVIIVVVVFVDVAVVIVTPQTSLQFARNLQNTLIDKYINATSRYGFCSHPKSTIPLGSFQI